MTDLKTQDKHEKFKYWTDQFSASRKALKNWHKEGKKVIQRFLDEKTNDQVLEMNQRKLNLFFSNIVTLKAMLYGNVPKAEVDRTFTDAEDDVARVAALIATRALQQDIEQSGEDFTTALQSALEDRLLPGFGIARVKYEYSEGMREIEAVLDPVTQKVIAEAKKIPYIEDDWVEIVYTHWQDVLWGKSRTYAETPWFAFRSFMDKDELKERWPELAEKIPLSSSGPTQDRSKVNTDDAPDKQAEVWEIWCKKTKKVYWMVEDYDILEEQDDPLGLENFFPNPRPMVANSTTSKFVPRSDYAMAQDLYTEIDALNSRISMLTEACRCVGVYDKANADIKRIFSEGTENDLIPVDNWAMLGEKGGLKGVIDWVPIEAVAKVIDILQNQLATKIQQLYEVTGMSDILRGAAEPYQAAATTKAKVQFASIRVQSLQDDFARFASDLQSLKLEVMQKHCQPQTFAKLSNIQMTPDAQFAVPAIQFLKDRNQAKWRIKIRPESLAQADYAQLKADRIDYIMGCSQFLQSMAPLVEKDPSATPILLELLKWGLAGFKGSRDIEGVMDRGIKMFAEKAKQPPPPDPEQQKLQAEMQMKQQDQQFKMQQEAGRMANERQEFQLKMQQEQQKFQAEMQRDNLKFQQEMTQMRAEFQLEMQKMLMELRSAREMADIKKDQIEHAAKIQMESRNAEAGRNSSD